MISRWRDEPFRDPPDDQHPWWLINFYLQIPFYVPYLNDATFNVLLPNEAYVNPPADLASSSPFVLMKVLQRATPAEEPVPVVMQRLMAELKSQGRWAGSTTPSTPQQPQLHLTTVIEAITPKLLLQSEKVRGVKLHPGALLDRCLWAFNRWMNSLALVTRDWSVRPLTKEQLPPIVLFFHQNPETRRLVHRDVLKLHSNIPWSSNQIVSPPIAADVAVTASNVEDHHTIWSAAQWLRAGERLAIVDGQYEMAIVTLHTAAELLLYGVAAVALVDEGKKSQELERLLRGRVSLSTICFHMLQPRFGGQWDRKSVTIPFGRYWQNILLRRNDVVHHGAQVTGEQMNAAMEAMAGLVDFISRRVERRRNTYTRTMMDITNVFGVPNGVEIGKAFNARAEALVRSEPRYWLPSDHARLKQQPSVLAETNAGSMPPTANPELVQRWRDSEHRPFRLLLRTIPMNVDIATTDGGNVNVTQPEVHEEA